MDSKTSKTTTTTATINFVRATSAIDGDGSAVSRSNARQDYVERRMKMWEGPEGGNSDYEQIQMGAIARLPLPLQVAFRRKMLTIFEMQLLLVWIVVGVFRFYPEAKKWGDDLFNATGNVVAAFGAATLALILLYFLRNRYPLNWVLLLVFSVSQAACGVGLGVAVDTNIGVFNCAFTFACVLIMIALSGARRKKATSDDGETATEEGALLSSFYAGMIAYVVVAIIASGLYANFGDGFVTEQGFSLTLGFQLVLMVWFAYDASCMYTVMSPDEYMHGVIYFYTDVILLIIICAIAVGVVMLCAALSDSGCDCGGGDCSGCTVCICPGDCYCGQGCCSSSSSNRTEQEDEVMNRV